MLLGLYLDSFQFAMKGGKKALFPLRFCDGGNVLCREWEEP